MRSVLAASAAFLVLTPIAEIQAAPAKQAAAPLVPSHLPRNAAPMHYAITVTPDAEKLRYDGKVRIEFLLKSPSQSITLNAADIEFREVADATTTSNISLRYGSRFMSPRTTCAPGGRVAS